MNRYSRHSFTCLQGLSPHGPQAWNLMSIAFNQGAHFTAQERGIGHMTMGPTATPRVRRPPRRLEQLSKGELTHW